MQFNGLDIFGWLLAWLGFSAILGSLVGRRLKSLNDDDDSRSDS